MCCKGEMFGFYKDSVGDFVLFLLLRFCFIYFFIWLFICVIFNKLLSISIVYNEVLNFKRII